MISKLSTRCQQCGLVLAHNPSCGTTSLKKHIATHVDNNSITQTVETPIVASPIPPVKKKAKLSNVETATEPRGKSWDQTFIEGIKNELQAPSQKTKDPETETNPGVSKFAISQLIQAQSNRVTFEESTTHSAVWEKFVKIALDTVEVPFVCCKLCKKVYTHDHHHHHLHHHHYHR